MNILNVIKKPVVTEKSQRLAAVGKYLFEIVPSATKEEVKKAVEALYKGVKVKSVAVAKSAGKKTSWRRKNKRPLEGERAGKKKAIVTLKEGKIEFFSGSEEPKKKNQK
ncbi:MAG: 50S ribosomal protein L23 [Patescibacteria group bacterium]